MTLTQCHDTSTPRSLRRLPAIIVTSSPAPTARLATRHADCVGIIYRSRGPSRGRPVACIKDLWRRVQVCCGGPSYYHYYTRTCLTATRTSWLHVPFTQPTHSSAHLDCLQPRNTGMPSSTPTRFTAAAQLNVVADAQAVVS